MSVAVAYLINQYPSVSHTFIRREIHALERQGLTIHRFSLRGWDLPLIDDVDLAERQRTRYVLQEGAIALLGAMLRTALRSPRRTASALRLTWKMARHSERALPIHLIYLAEACMLQEWMSDCGAKHLHAHFATNPAEVAMLTATLGGTTYSFTAHGSDIMDRPAQMGLDETVGRAAFVAAVCSFGRSQIFKWTPHALWGKVKVIRCGLEPGYGRASTPSAPSNMRLVCVGRLSPEKGQMLLVEAAHRLTLQGVAVELTLAGDGPMRAEIEDLVKSCGLTARVRITGWLDAAGVERELREARALVVSSLSEGLPVVIMEAMANQRPVIAPFLAGIPELVVAGESGWLFPAGDVSALADAMRACLEATPDRLLVMGRKAQNRVWTAHDVDAESSLLGKLIGAGVASPSLPQPDQYRT